jgi:uncharacterized protein YciI
MKIRSFAIAILLVSLLASQSFGQSGEHKLVQFQMAIMKKGPQLASTTAQERNQIFQQHVANVLSLLESGRAIIAGPFGDDTDLAGIFILRASSTAEAKGWVDGDPAVKAGLMVPEMHPWWSEDIFNKANLPLKSNTVYFAFLKRGPNRTEGDDQNPEIQELQKAHLANINRLAAMKKLVVAGPFGDNSNLRGIFVLRVPSLKEAQDLCATDPMVKSGRLVVELHPWQIPEGVLP